MIARARSRAVPVTLAVLACASGFAWARPAMAAPSRVARDELSANSRSAPDIYDTSHFFDGNEIRCPITNLGILGRDPDAGAGFEWPQGSGKKVAYTAGLWLVAQIFGTPRAAIADFQSEFTPGPMTSTGEAADPFGVTKTYRVWKITQDDLTSPGLDYIDWPNSQGAPFDTAGAPMLLGEQTLYCIFNDAWEDNHSLLNGSTLQLQAEVSQLVWGYNRPYEMSRAMFVSYHIHNRSRFRWPEFYAGIWADPDIGDPTDDLAGCDSALQLGYVYDSFSDLKKGEVPPAVGIVVLADSISGVASPGLKSIVGFPLAEDPVTFWETLNYLRGYKRTGQSWFCPDSTHFPFAGDPATGTGCLDTRPGDKRIALAPGPFDLVSNASLDVVVAYLVGADPAARVPADNVAALRRLAETVRNQWRESFASIPPLPKKAAILATFPNPTTGATSMDLAVPANTRVDRLEVLDVRGRVIWTVPAPPTRSGITRLRWNGETVSGVPAPAGVYVLRVITDSGPVLARTARLR